MFKNGTLKSTFLDIWFTSRIWCNINVTLFSIWLGGSTKLKNKLRRWLIKLDVRETCWNLHDYFDIYTLFFRQIIQDYIFWGKLTTEILISFQVTLEFQNNDCTDYVVKYKWKIFMEFYFEKIITNKKTLLKNSITTKKKIF